MADYEIKLPKMMSWEELKELLIKTAQDKKMTTEKTYGLIQIWPPDGSTDTQTGLKIKKLAYEMETEKHLPTDHLMGVKLTTSGMAPSYEDIIDFSKRLYKLIGE